MKKVFGIILIVLSSLAYLKGKNPIAVVFILLGLVLIFKPKKEKTVSVQEQPKESSLSVEDHKIEELSVDAETPLPIEDHKIEERSADAETPLPVEDHKIEELSVDAETPCQSETSEARPEKLPDSYVVFDVETTGLDCSKCSIIEIAGVKVVDRKVVDTFSSLINPGVHITKKITDITGLSDADLIDAEFKPEVIPRFYKFTEDLPLVAHNIRFDWSFYRKELQDCGIKLKGDQGYDTLQFARDVFPGLESYKLNTLIQKFNLAEGEQTHRALDDALATQKLFELCREKAQELGLIE